jgi:hypothetical protein
MLAELSFCSARGRGPCPAVAAHNWAVWAARSGAVGVAGVPAGDVRPAQRARMVDAELVIAIEPTVSLVAHLRRPG